MAIGEHGRVFERPVTVLLGGTRRQIGTVEQAVDLLGSVDWPERGPRRRDAFETCLKVLDGHRTTENARRELVEAAREAGIAVEE